MSPEEVEADIRKSIRRGWFLNVNGFTPASVPEMLPETSPPANHATRGRLGRPARPSVSDPLRRARGAAPLAKPPDGSKIRSGCAKPENRASRLPYFL